MSEPNEPQNGLGAELRGRIAETLFRLYGPHLGYADVTWDQIDQELWREDADAVIAELGLRREDLGGFRVPGYGHRGYRYVTDWTADD